MKVYNIKNKKQPETPMNISRFLHDQDTGLYVQDYFREILYLERKRAERSRKPFVLMLVDITKLAVNGHRKEFVSKMSEALEVSTREIDVKGWYTREAVMGVIFTETGNKEIDSLSQKISSALSAEGVLGPELFKGVDVSFHVFPEEATGDHATTPFDDNLYPELPGKNEAKKGALFLKRVFDVVGSIIAILLFLPLFILIPLLIKLTSTGPVFFRQTRIGAFGRPFTFLKFRTMQTNNDPKIHAEYVKKLIRDQKEHSGSGDGTEKVFKIQNDPRVTPLGRFLRKTSLDELPQFFNVLMGQMSLVGPRPPIPYELENYDTWHLRRVLELRPGITGLWQVKGRSKTTFNEMVRMDIRYIDRWSLWLDIKLILETPWTMLTSKGAY